MGVLIDRGVPDRSTQEARGSSIFIRRVTSQPRSPEHACVLLPSVPVDACSTWPSSAGPGRPAVELPPVVDIPLPPGKLSLRSEEHTSELQSLRHLVCR